MRSVDISKFIVEINEDESLDPSVVGSKAAAVAELAKHKIKVPPCFTIKSSVFDDFIRPIADEITNILEKVETDNASSAFEAAESICEILASQELPVGLTESVKSRLISTKTTMAVRSSATTEDLKDASFAGIYETFLDATTLESVLRRIRDVWASYYTGRAISYRQQKGIAHQSGSMAVLVMDLIDAEAAGVMFTRDPRDGSDHILINVALGLGEGVVSGEAEADSFVLETRSMEITKRNVIDKEWMFKPRTAGTLKRVRVPSEKRGSPAIKDSTLTALAKTAMEIKTATGSHRDIEFALKNDTIHILQSRPITAGGNKKIKFPVRWGDSIERKRHWTIRGTEPALPLHIDYVLASAEAEKRSIATVGQYMGRRNLKKIVNGYIFTAEPDYDSEVLESRLQKHHDKGNEFLEKGTTLYYAEVEPQLLINLDNLDHIRPEDHATLPEHIANLKATTLTAAEHQSNLHWQSWGGFREKGGLEKLFTEITGRPAMDASSLTMAIDHMTARLTRRLMNLARLVKSNQWLIKIFENRDYDTLFARGNGVRPSVSKFRIRFRAMMKIWGCRNGIGYGTAWKPTDPTWNMKPEIPLDVIGSFVRQDITEHMRLLRNLKDKRKKAIESVHAKIGGNKNLREAFRAELFKATNYVKMMEDHNYLIEQRTFGEYRESINRTGVALKRKKWIDAVDDIFYLRLAELDDAADSQDYTSLKSIVARSKEAFKKNSKLSPPESLGAKPNKKDGTENVEKKSQGLSSDGQILHGEPSSPGSFTGRARVVITRTSKPPSVKKGDILITENTGPDWVPIFPLIGALVLDGGDNFQHASLICREYGIPCVIKTKQGTEAIANGQIVKVDGSNGVITLNPMT